MYVDILKVLFACTCLQHYLCCSTLDQGWPRLILVLQQTVQHGKQVLILHQLLLCLYPAIHKIYTKGKKILQYHIHVVGRLK